MTKKQLLEIAGQVTISPDCQTILFIDRTGMTVEQGQIMMNKLNARFGGNKLTVVFVNGNPNFVVKAVAFDQEGKEVSE